MRWGQLQDWIIGLFWNYKIFLFVFSAKKSRRLFLDDSLVEKSAPKFPFCWILMVNVIGYLLAPVTKHGRQPCGPARRSQVFGRTLWKQTCRCDEGTWVRNWEMSGLRSTLDFRIQISWHFLWLEVSQSLYLEGDFRDQGKPWLLSAAELCINIP